jgi:hypothetical protein
MRQLGAPGVKAGTEVLAAAAGGGPRQQSQPGRHFAAQQQGLIGL